MTKLRRVIRAVDGFQYEVEQLIVSERSTSTEILYLKIDQTNIRCLQHDMHHERLVGSNWFIITEDEFNEALKKYKFNKIKTRKKSGETVTKKKTELSLVNKFILTDHALDRLEERFNVKGVMVPVFLHDTLQGHFIVQNFEFYTGRYKANKANHIVVCSKDFKKILVVEPKGGRLVLITCYDPRSMEYSSFDRWFQDHLNVIHKLPSLKDFV